MVYLLIWKYNQLSLPLYSHLDSTCLQHLSNRLVFVFVHLQSILHEVTRMILRKYKSNCITSLFNILQYPLITLNVIKSKILTKAFMIFLGYLCELILYWCLLFFPPNIHTDFPPHFCLCTDVTPQRGHI